MRKCVLQVAFVCICEHKEALEAMFFILPSTCTSAPGEKEDGMYPARIRATENCRQRTPNSWVVPVIPVDCG